MDKNVPKQLATTLNGDYWKTNCTDIYLAATTEYSNLHANIVTQQYAFNLKKKDLYPLCNYVFPYCCHSKEYTQL